MEREARLYSLADELNSRLEELVVGCMQLERFHGLTNRVSEELIQESRLSDEAISKIEQIIQENVDSQIVIQVEDVDTPIELSVTEAQNLVRTARMGMEIEHNYTHIGNNMILIYVTTLFEAYLVDIARSVMMSIITEVNETEQEAQREPAEYRANLDELIISLVDRQMDDLAFRSIQNKIKFLQKTLNITFTGKGYSKADINELYATRNILVHNGGIINRQYISTAPKMGYEIGDKRELDDEYTLRAIDIVRLAGTAIHKACMQRFSATQKPMLQDDASRLYARLNSYLDPEDED